MIRQNHPHDSRKTQKLLHGVPPLAGLGSLVGTQFSQSKPGTPYPRLVAALRPRCAPTWISGGADAGLCQLRFLNRQLALPVSMMS
jgi:hypothetical protein